MDTNSTLALIVFAALIAFVMTFRFPPTST